jgi:CRP-like cAMP-binding protein
MMALKDDIALLRTVTLFSDMNDEQLRLIAFGAERMHVANTQTLFFEGDAADCAYIVAHGRLVLTSTDRTGAMHLVANAGSGTLISELAMISNVERKFNATAAEDSEVLKITRTLFHRLLDEYPEVVTKIQDRIREHFNTLTLDVSALTPRFS